MADAALIDIGANLAHDSFAADLQDVLARAWAADLQAIIVTGSCAHSNAQAAALARQHHGRLYATAGLHPHHASDWNDVLAAQIRTLAQAPEVVALGECGLDYFRDLSPRPRQRQAFVEQLRLAADTGKPVFLHQRDAHDDFHAVLREHRAALVDAVVHCFTDNAEALDAYLALDCHIGITGWICDERRGQNLRELVRRIPAERLLIETDAPYLTPRNAPPVPHLPAHDGARGNASGDEPSAAERPRPRKSSRQRNEPALLPWVLQAIAEARGERPAALAAQTCTNARRCFRLDAVSARAAG